MRSRHVANGVAIIAAVWLAMGSVAPARCATPKEIDQTIEKLKADIYAAQINGNWEIGAFPAPQNVGGMTALTTYALLASGENPQDPRIQQAVTYLENIQLVGIYAIGLRCQVWLNLPRPHPKEIKQVFEHDAKTLLAAAHPDPKLREIPSAFYRYTIDATDWDHSVSQYGVLGLWACAQADIEIPLRYWQAVDAGWRAHQLDDGGWNYFIPPNPRMQFGVGGAAPPPPSTASMTAAGVATLFISEEYAHGMEGVECPGNVVDTNIAAGLDWMGKNFKTIYTGLMPYYALYGVERIGVASGRKYIGAVDWYKEGADYIVAQQQAQLNVPTLNDNCFALLFLVRGRAPLMVNKLQYDITARGKSNPANWNQRPRDAANITKWVGRENEHYLNWQIVDLKTPIDELHEAPILYIAGNQAIDFTNDELAKLRQFVEEGGLIFANADCAIPAFSQSFEKLCRKLYPDYEMRDLPADSPIYTREQFIRDRWKNKPRVQALSNGARELAILCPKQDPARYWQTQAYGGHEELHQLMADIFLYTVNRGEKGSLLNRGETTLVRPDPAITAGKSIKIARLEYAGNWDPEPAGWRRLAALMHNTQDLDLAITPVKLGTGKLDKSYKVAHLTGTFGFSLPPAARDEIAKYVAGGGTLIVDACGGSGEFSKSAEKEIAAIFPNDPLPPTPLPVYTPAFMAEPRLESVDYRSFARKVVGKLSTPRLRGITIGGRLAVFFSGEDLSCGIVGLQTDGIYGYDPASATAIMEKLVLFAGK